MTVYDRLSPPDERDDYRFYLPLIMVADAVLDVGCGTGALLHLAREAGHAGRLAAKQLRPIRQRSGLVTSRLDRVARRSPAGKAVDRVRASAKTDHDRRVFPTYLGKLLVWCDGRGIEPHRLWRGDLHAYRKDLLADGSRSPGDALRVARRFVVALERDSRPTEPPLAAPSRW